MSDFCWQFPLGKPWILWNLQVGSYRSFGIWWPTSCLHLALFGAPWFRWFLQIFLVGRRSAREEQEPKVPEIGWVHVGDVFVGVAMASWWHLNGYVWEFLYLEDWHLLFFHQDPGVLPLYTRMLQPRLILQYSFHTAFIQPKRVWCKKRKKDVVYIFSLGEADFNLLGNLHNYHIYKLFFTKQEKSLTATNESNQLILTATCQNRVQSFVGFLGLQSYMTLQKTWSGQVHPSKSAQTPGRKCSNGPP